MVMQNYTGLHGTSLSAAEKIRVEGFKISPTPHFFGRAVYFYSDTAKGRKLAQAHAKSRAQKKGDSYGAIITAQFAFESNRVADLSIMDRPELVRGVHQLVSANYPHLSEEEHVKKCNELHIRLVTSLIESGEITEPEMIMANMPFGWDYALGYAVMDTGAIKIMKCEKFSFGVRHTRQKPGRQSDASGGNNGQN